VTYDIRHTTYDIRHTGTTTNTLQLYHTVGTGTGIHRRGVSLTMANTVTIAKEIYWRHISDTVEIIEWKDAALVYISLGREASSRPSPSDSPSASPSAVVVLCDGKNSFRPKTIQTTHLPRAVSSDPTRTGFVVVVCGFILVEPSSSSSTFFVEPSCTYSTPSRSERDSGKYIQLLYTCRNTHTPGFSLWWGAVCPLSVQSITPHPKPPHF
jgi:hypothetical protein